MTRSTRLALAALAVLSVAAPAVARADNEYPMYVWKVTGPDADPGAEPDYVIGTLRVPAPEGKGLPAKVKAIVKGATTVVSEVEYSERPMSDAAEYLAWRGPQPLSQLMPAATWKKATAILAKKGFPAEQAAMIAPWFLAAAVIEMPTEPGKSPKTMEDHLRAYALSAKVGLDYLETADVQLKTLAALKKEEAVLQLVDAVERPAEVKAVNDRTTEGYFSGDLKRATEAVQSPFLMKRYPDYWKRMVVDRTSNWLQRVDELCQDEDAVVAVSLTNLVGEKGLLKLLTNRGYTIEQVKL